MHHYFRLLFLSLSIVPFGATAGNVTGDARTWFLTQFVPLWEDLDKANPEKMEDFWVERFRDHPIDMDSSIWENATETWQRNIERNMAEGLRGSSVIETKVEEISDRAVLIRAVWQDRGLNGPIEEPYCNVYIAGRFQGEWKFTNYFTIECSTE